MTTHSRASARGNCIEVSEVRGTRCLSADSLELTLTMSEDCEKEKVYYDIYSQHDAGSPMRWVEGGTVYSDHDTVVLFCTEPNSYEIREKE